MAELGMALVFFVGGGVGDFIGGGVAGGDISNV